MLARGHYDPLRWPPDLEQAQLHSQASRPGLPSATCCPCCEQPCRRPFESFFWQDEAEVLGARGRGVAGYFLLLKVYLFAAIVVVTMFSVYHIYLINWVCNSFRAQACVHGFGLWVISQADLTNAMLSEGLDVTFFKALQLVVFLWLSLVNLFTVYLLSAEPGQEQSEALLVKNVPAGECPFQSRVRDALGCDCEVMRLAASNRLFRLSEERLHLLFRLKHKLVTHKQASKLAEQLGRVQQEYLEAESRMDQSSRAIVLLSGGGKPLITNWAQEWVQYLTCREPSLAIRVCPQPHEILWENLGENTRSRMTRRVISAGASLLLLVALAAVLAFPFAKANNQETAEIPLGDKLFSLCLAYGLLFVAIAFRLVNNRLADLRLPGTASERVLFIVSVTVLFHFLFYLLVPVTFYSYEGGRQGSLKLFSISFQAFNFILFQMIIAGADLFLRVWRSKAIQLLNPNSEHSGLFCQFTLHQAVEYPRFPIEFKLIVLLKTWSFVLFYAFEMPQIACLLAVMLACLFYFDKRGVFWHYRVESTGLSVEVIRRLISFYSSFFAVALGYFYLLNNHRLAAERIIAGTVTLAKIAGIMWLLSRPLPPRPAPLLRETHWQSYTRYLESVRSQRVSALVEDVLAQAREL